MAGVLLLRLLGAVAVAAGAQEHMPGAGPSGGTQPPSASVPKEDAAGSRASITLDEIRRRIHERVSTYTTIQYELEMVSEFKARQLSSTNTTRQTGQFMRRAGKVLSRIETSAVALRQGGGKEQQSAYSSLDVCDGDYQYNLMDRGGEVRATRRRVDPAKRYNPFDADRIFRDLEARNDLRVLPDETVDGHDCWAIEMRPHDAEGRTAGGWSVAYYDKKTGINIRTIGYDRRGTVRTRMNTTKIRIDEPIDESRFLFEAPEGVTLVDLTEPPPPPLK